MSVKVAQYPGQVWDGLSTVRNDRTINRVPDYPDWDQAVAEVIALQTQLDTVKFISMPNTSGGTTIPGQPLYALANGTGAASADANGSVPTRNIIGLATAGVIATATQVIQKHGDLTLTTAQWDSVVGTTGGLAANTEYYLSDTAGVITATAPSTSGDAVISIGIAKSATVLNINPQLRKLVP